VTLTKTHGGLELLAVTAAIDQDKMTLEEMEKLLGYFNQVAGTNYTFADISQEKQIERSVNAETLELIQRTLWILDLGKEVYPCYAVSQAEAEFSAQVVERGRSLPRRSLCQHSDGWEEYPGRLVVLAYTTYRTLSPHEGLCFTSREA
ncbi:MAG: hypothetical protein JO183_09595, partial [Ktedonobacteraceae bacterium]|nr:hypothetical protein [Ktedonobacteraceae bacterium]